MIRGNTVTQAKGVTVTRRSIQEYLAAQRERYQRASRDTRRQLLDEMGAVTGYHRKALIRQLRPTRPRPLGGRPVGRPRPYGPAVAAAAQILGDT